MNLEKNKRVLKLAYYKYAACFCRVVYPKQKLIDNNFNLFSRKDADAETSV